MIAGKHDIYCQQGAVFNLLIDVNEPDIDTDPTGQTFQPLDLRNHTARMQVRRTIDSPNFLVSLTTENGGLIINPNATEPFPYEEFNQIQIFMSHNMTAGINSNGVYDLEIVNEDGYVSRLLEGNFYLSRNVTK